MSQNRDQIILDVIKMNNSIDYILMGATSVLFKSFATIDITTPFYIFATVNMYPFIIFMREMNKKYLSI